MAGYGDDSGFAAWLTENGYSLPSGSPSAAVLRLRGSVYVDGTYGSRFAGKPTGGAMQEREWPRTGAVDRYGAAISDGIVPQRVVEASYHAAYAEAVTPGSLAASGSEASRVKREKVEGAVEVEYQASSGFSAASLTPVLTVVEGLLSPFLSPVTGIPHALVV